VREDVRTVEPGPLDGEVEAPPSKSLFQRAVAAATLAGGTTLVRASFLCADAEASLRAARALGARVEILPGVVKITGRAGPPGGEIDCGESGLTLRIFAPLAALQDRPVVLSGSGSLFRRPAHMIPPALEALGGACETKGGFPPLRVQGPLRSGRAEVDGRLTSQVLSGLLLALPVCEGESQVLVRELRSKGYVQATLRVLEEFGVRVEADLEAGEFRIPGGQEYSPIEYDLEGDWSGAAFLLVAGALAGRVTVTGLDPGSSQPDRGILEALERAGAKVEVTRDCVRVERDRLEGFTFDAVDRPDLFPPLAVLGAFCRGRTVLKGAGRLRHKESDRAAALAEGLSRLGAEIQVAGDLMILEGRILHGGKARARGDHRIAMALAVAGLSSESPVHIAGASSVTKSYPRFFQDLRSLGGRVV